MTTVENIIEFVENWRGTKGITPGGVLNEMNTVLLTHDLLAEIDKMSFDAGGSKIIPYNGWFGDVPAWQAAEGVINIV